MTIEELEALVEQARRGWGEAEDEAKRAYHEYIRLCGELREMEDREGVGGPDKIHYTKPLTRIPIV